MPSNSFVLNSHQCYPAVQQLTASTGGAGKGIPSSPEKKKKLYACTNYISITR